MGLSNQEIQQVIEVMSHFSQRNGVREEMENNSDLNLNDDEIEEQLNQNPATRKMTSDQLGMHPGTAIQRRATAKADQQMPTDPTSGLSIPGQHETAGKHHR